MEFITLLGTLLVIASVIFATHLNSNLKGTLTNWPVIGMLPSLLLNLYCFHDWSTRILARNGGTFVFKGPWFTNMNMIWTCDPANVRYVSTANFLNFPKGQEFREMFDILGDGIFNSDSEAWLSQRKCSQALINHSRFFLYLKTLSLNMLEKGLIPFFEHVAKNDLVVDMQDVFFRFAFEMTCSWTTGSHLGCLAIELPEVPIVVAIDIAFKAIFKRHYKPKTIWKLQRRLGIGAEHNIKKARRVVDDFITECITRKREQLSETTTKKKEDDVEEENVGIGGSSTAAAADLLSLLMEEDGDKSDKYLRDFIFSYLIAGYGSISIVLTWFLWLLSQNPSVETKIMEELLKLKSPINKGKRKSFNMEEVSELFYLHGALCESLRLYPPVWIEHKNSVQEDVLPSGHKVDSNGRVMLFIYSMGRMEGIWGEDCLEFKPERWIANNSQKSGINYHPSYKFPAFHSGPRICPGKDIAFTLMKMVAATLLYNYHIHVEQAHPAYPKLSLGLYKENGLMAKIKKREV